MRKPYNLFQGLRNISPAKVTHLSPFKTHSDEKESA